MLSQLRGYVLENMKLPVQYRTLTSIVRGWLFRAPVYVQVAVTPRCNLNCRMCQVAKTWRGEHELSLAEIGRIADTLRKLGVGYVVLTGGEPFLRRDLPEIVKLFSIQGFDVRLQTNGTLTTPELADHLVESGLRHISVSLNSLFSEKEEELAGRSGVWNKIVETLALFSQRLPARGSMLVLNSIVTPLTLAEAPALAEFAFRAGFFNSFIPVHVTDESMRYNYRTPETGFRFPPQQHPKIDQIYARLIELKDRGYPVFGSRRFLRASAEFLKTGKTHWHCPIPGLFFEVAPDGRYSPCSEFTTSHSLLEPGFVDLYRSAPFRREVRGYALNCPGCMYACWPEVTYICTSPLIFFRRAREFWRLLHFRRPVLSQKELEDIARRCRCRII